MTSIRLHNKTTKNKGLPVSTRLVILLTLIVLFASAACTSGEIDPNAKILNDGVKTAETYWNAQKVSDAILFHSVTPYESMNIVFEWSYINKTDVLVEEASVESIKSDIQQFLEHHKKYDNTPKYTKDSISELKAIIAYATRIKENGHPILGNLLMKGYWSTVVPSNFLNMQSYKLMTLQYIADVKVQSKAGGVLQKRTTLHLYRMQADSHDSDWKVLFVEGL